MRQRPERVGYERGHRGREGAEAHARLAPAVEVREREARRLQLGQRRGGMTREQLPGGGQLRAARMTLEQRAPDGLLDVCDLARYRRLGVAERRGGR